jgi:hypothetical protein
MSTTVSTYSIWKAGKLIAADRERGRGERVAGFSGSQTVSEWTALRAPYLCAGWQGLCVE